MDANKKLCVINFDTWEIPPVIHEDCDYYTIICGGKSITLTRVQLKVFLSQTEMCDKFYRELKKYQQINRSMVENNKNLIKRLESFSNLGHGHDCSKDE